MSDFAVTLQEPGLKIVNDAPPMKVFKYVFEGGITSGYTISMPQGAEPLHVGLQHGRICLWARVNPGAKMVDHHFRLVGTGHDGADGRYLGTVSFHSGDLVFHIFALD